MKETKHPTSIRFSPTAERLVETLAARLGVSKSAILELAIRCLAQQQGVPIGQEEE